MKDLAPRGGLALPTAATAAVVTPLAMMRVRLERDNDDDDTKTDKTDCRRRGDRFTEFGTTIKKPEAVFRPGDKGLGVEGRPAPVVTKEGLKAYEVRLEKGKIQAPGSNMYAFFVPDGFFPAERVRFSFKVWFADNFPWGSSQKKVGGKLLGFRIGAEGDAQGGDYSPTAASFRLTWALNGGVGPYLYPQVRKEYSKKESGRIGWDLLDQSADVRSVCQIASGLHMFYPEDRKDIDNWDLQLHKGRWNEVEMFCKLNTPGKHDGVLEVTINGVTKRLDSVRYRYDHAKIENVKVNTFFGGGTDDYAPPADTKIWYADFGFSRR